MKGIFKPRSPMSMDARALSTVARAGNAVIGGYLGSYTGVLLASTAVPLWARSRSFLGPIFVSTATATGAAAVRLMLRGAPESTFKALGQVQTGAMVAELALSTVNERRVKRFAEPLHHSSKLRWAKRLVNVGLGLQALKQQRVASVVYLAAGLLFRYAWVEAGPISAVAEIARSFSRPVS
jgi:hypothetical protein